MITRIAQVSDAHLSAARPFFAANFALVAEAVRAAEPDLMLATGDLSLDGADGDADLAHAVAEHAAIGRPWLCVPGNHDVGDDPALGGGQPANPARLERWRRLAGPSAWVHDVAGWRLIGLDSQSLAVDEAQWEIIGRGLRDAGPRRIALIQHKPLTEESIGDTAVNYWPVLPRARARLLGLGRPALVLSGHVHQFRAREAEGIAQIWAPATSFIVGDAWQRRVGDKLLGWLEHEFHADGAHRHILRTVEGMPLDDIGAMPEVYGPLPRLPD